MKTPERTVFFVGKPGCGKGTQAELLSKKTGWPILSTSAGLREIVTAGGLVGEKLKETMDSGLLTPYWMAAHVFLKYLFGLPTDQGVIFDGANRDIGEAEIVVDSLRWLGRPFSIIHLKTSDDEVRSRIARRKETEGRADDHDAAVEKRITAYYECTDKVIDYLRSAGLLSEVNGEGGPEVIAMEVRKVLGIE